MDLFLGTPGAAQAVLGRFEQVAKEPKVQLIILDNQDFLRHGYTT